jgi:hypothetical protein
VGDLTQCSILTAFGRLVRASIPCRSPIDAKDGRRSAAIDPFAILFYRVQVTPQIALTPTPQMIIDPVENPDEDVVWFLGIRSRFNF